MKPALDDWLVVISLVFYYLSAIETVLQVGIGRLGHHLNGGITPDQLIKMGKVRPITPLFCVDGRPDSISSSSGLSDNTLTLSQWAPFDGRSVPFYTAYLSQKDCVGSVSK